MSIYTMEERKRRWVDFLDMKSPVKQVFLVEYYDEGTPARPMLWRDKKKERIEWAWQMYNQMLEHVQWLRDDSLPFLDNLTGTEIFAEAFGCKVHRPSDNNPFALAMIHSAAEVSKVKVPRLEDSSLVLLFEIADELQARAGKGALLKPPDMQSPIDIASLIWDKNDFYIALIEEPEAVKELAGKVKELLTAFLDEWFRRYGTEFIAHFPNYYMPKGITLSEDEVGVINGDMFMEFCLPELSDLSERYGGIGMHCCANAQHQWENFKKIPNLRLLNFVQPEEVLRDAYQCFADHVPQMHSWNGNGESWTWPQSYPKGAHVVLQTRANTKDEALFLSEKLWKACGRE
jgi:hypothetical protein